MTLISNKYKFIYIKTHRTSSTATQEFFKQFADECYTKSSTAVKKGFLYNHSTAEEIRTFLIKNNREDVWNNYTKICIIRNPYATLLSLYGWFCIRNKTKIKDFNTFITNNNAVLNNTWVNNYKKKLFIGDNLIIDKYIIYEDKENTINNVLKFLDINSKYKKEKTKVNYVSPFCSDDYQKHFNEHSLQLCQKNSFFKKYCKQFNYSF